MTEYWLKIIPAAIVRACRASGCRVVLIAENCHNGHSIRWHNFDPVLQRWILKIAVWEAIISWRCDGTLRRIGDFSDQAKLEMEVNKAPAVLKFIYLRL
jgi:hypothetical protein